MHLEDDHANDTFPDKSNELWAQTVRPMGMNEYWKHSSASQIAFGSIGGQIPGYQKRMDDIWYI